MQSLQAMSKVPTQSANLPPLQNLPSWSRNSLGRRKQPRQIIRDRLQPIKSITEELDENAHDKSNEKPGYLGRIVSAPSRDHGLDQEQKIENIEKRIDYLRTEHAETLSNLHREIERLKAENKGELLKTAHVLIICSESNASLTFWSMNFWGLWTKNDFYPRLDFKGKKFIIQDYAYYYGGRKSYLKLNLT